MKCGPVKAAVILWITLDYWSTERLTSSEDRSHINDLLLNGLF